MTACLGLVLLIAGSLIHSAPDLEAAAFTDDTRIILDGRTVTLDDLPADGTTVVRVVTRLDTYWEQQWVETTPGFMELLPVQVMQKIIVLFEVRTS
jgi:hypothetical protein